MSGSTEQLVDTLQEADKTLEGMLMTLRDRVPRFERGRTDMQASLIEANLTLTGCVDQLQLARRLLNQIVQD